MVNVKKWLLTAVAMTALFVLAACGDKTYEPREINAETDVCYMCNMSITHAQYAGQIVKKNNDVIVFDDIGCLMEYIAEYGDSEVGAAFIRDNNSNAWLNVEEASYVYSADYWTPMNFGVLAFADDEAANAYMSEQPGELKTYDDLTTFNWGVHTHE